MFDLITIVVLPALHAAMTRVVMLANQGLIPKNIFCISPRIMINVTGSGQWTAPALTITEYGKDIWGVMLGLMVIILISEICMIDTNTVHELLQRQTNSSSASILSKGTSPVALL